MPRLLTALATSGSITLALLWVMQQLLVADVVQPALANETMPITFVRLAPEPPQQTTEVEPPVRPPEPLPSTPRGVIPAWDNTDISRPKAAPGPGSAPTAPGYGPIDAPAKLSDGALLPLVRVAADYPLAAIRSGREGFVDLRFSVNANGKVENINVTFATHPVFRNAAMRAVAKFKYKPRIRDGQAVAVHNVETRIRFEID